jgi:outer membrane beta-barrel protein
VIRSKPIWAVTLILGFLTAGTANAETIEVPDEELATETVLPVFDKTRSVLNKNVQTEGRIEIGGGGGMALNEPFYNPMNFNLNATYHMTDLHAVNVNATFFMTGLNSYGEQLQAGEGLAAGESFDASKAPAPKWMLLGNYQFTAYYGKVSLSKKAIMNLELFGLAGLGVIQTGGISNYALDVGFGQNFYITPRLAARFDIKLLMYNGPDATSLDLEEELAAPDEGAFETNWFFKTYLSLGLVFLL